MIKASGPFNIRTHLKNTNIEDEYEDGQRYAAIVLVVVLVLVI